LIYSIDIFEYSKFWMTISILLLCFFILDHNKWSVLIYEILDKLFIVPKTILLDNGKDVSFLLHVELMCSMIYENCVNKGQKSHLRLLFYTTKSCVSLHFRCLSSDFHFFFFFIFLCIISFSHKRKVSLCPPHT